MCIRARICALLVHKKSPTCEPNPKGHPGTEQPQTTYTATPTHTHARTHVRTGALLMSFSSRTSRGSWGAVPNASCSSPFSILSEDRHFRKAHGRMCQRTPSTHAYTHAHTFARTHACTRVWAHCVYPFISTHTSAP